MKRSLVLGVNGQDGSFLAEILTGRGNKVCGLGRQPTSRYILDGLSFRYLPCDLRDQDKLKRVLDEAMPDEIYHVAAVHGPAGFSYEAIWGDVLDLNVKSLHTVLEYARRENRDIRIFYASSAKVFGTPLKGRISIESAKRHDCLYSVSKLAAENLLDYYRTAHGIHASIAYLFNHESVRRPSSYFIPTVMSALASAIHRRDSRTEIYTLDFYCDWGCAQEYMEMATELIQATTPSDLIFATGKTWYGRDLVKELFASYGLHYCKHLLERAPKLDPVYFQVDIDETVRHLGRIPQRDILDVCRDFITVDGPR
ncbi:MAG: GDP-mannose 4,6-dehydratase [Desulfomonilaceae bacterium]